MHLFGRSALAALLLLVSVGCASDPGPLEQMTVTKSCTQTRCASKSADASRDCSRCLSACSSAGYSCNPSTACDYSCGEREVYCSDEDRTKCLETGFKAELPENVSAGLESACNRMRTRDASCGIESVPAEACGRFAKVERAEMETVYDCLAKLPCDAATEACTPAPTNLGDELCGGGPQACEGLCDDATRDALNVEGGWLRADVQQAARGCLSYDTCSDVTQCLRAWFTAAVR